MGNHSDETLFESEEIFSTENAALDAGFQIGKQKIETGFRSKNIVKSSSRDHPTISRSLLKITLRWNPVRLPSARTSIRIIDPVHDPTFDLPSSCSSHGGLSSDKVRGLPILRPLFHLSVR